MVGFDRKIIKLYFSQQRLQHLSSRFECNLSSFKRNKEHEILSYLYKTRVGLQIMLNNGITTYNILFIVFIIFFLLKKDLDGTFLKIIFLLYTSIVYTTK